ncbi:MAG TPA: glucuronate isomerase, partial [Clostridiales bacterium]|nr:glucuronate isomerase [Clostridiales bacterium]
DSFEELKAALLKRIEFFAEMGCKATDHALGGVPFALSTPDELEAIFKKGKNGETLTQEEADKYKTALLRFLAKEYYKKGWAMEIHIGALRNNNTRMFEKLGPDTGFDSIDDRQIAYPLSRLLDSIDKEGMLPKTILFTLNPKDNYVLGTMIGNFQSDEIGSKMQFGTAWWFNDNIDGMEAQIKALANLGCLGKFIGMLTDSRSFLSYPRHEYFRRILCNFMGGLVENGEYPFDLPALERMVKDISYYNAVKYFGLEL